MQEFSLVNKQSTKISRFEIQKQSLNVFMILSRKLIKECESARNF